MQIADQAGPTPTIHGYTGKLLFGQPANDA